MSGTNSDFEIDRDLESAALEIGRAFLNAHRTAFAVVSKSSQEPHMLPVRAVADVRTLEGAAATGTLNPDREVLAAQVDAIERSLRASQDRLIRLLEEPGALYTAVAPVDSSTLTGNDRDSETIDLTEPSEVLGVEQPQPQAQAAIAETPPDSPSTVDVEPSAGAIDPSEAVEIQTSDAEDVDSSVDFAWAPPHPATAVDLAVFETEESTEEAAPPAHGDADRSESEPEPVVVGGVVGDPRVPESGATPAKSRPWMANVIAAGVVIVIVILALLLVSAL